MIRNERQYRITKTHIAKLDQALVELTQPTNEVKNIHPLLLKAEQNGIRSQIADLRTELMEYEKLKEGKYTIPTLDQFTEFPLVLIKARIAKRLTQKELAERLGLKEQQIQKYESTEYASASLSRVREVAEALGIKLTDNYFSKPSETSLASLINRLKEVGIDRDLIIKRIIPASLSSQFHSGKVEAIDNIIFQIAQHVGRIFGWATSDILESKGIQLEMKTVAAKLSVPARTNKKRLNAYIIYAHYLALTLLNTMKSKKKRMLPVDPYETRDEILARYDSLTLPNVLQYLWGLGILMLPLNDTGSFHGAYFREDFRNMIVLKQKTYSPDRWMFDALHEAYHTLQESEKPNLVVIEYGDMSQERLSSKEETTASQYAGAVLLGKNPQKLAEKCLNEANRDIRMLKSAVKRVASAENLPIGSLANYMAFRLSLDGQNWWGTAENLQEKDTNPFKIARDILLDYIDLSKLADPDLQLVQRAIIE